MTIGFSSPSASCRFLCIFAIKDLIYAEVHVTRGKPRKSPALFPYVALVAISNGRAVGQLNFFMSLRSSSYFSDKPTKVEKSRSAP